MFIDVVEVPIERPAVDRRETRRARAPAEISVWRVVLGERVQARASRRHAPEEDERAFPIGNRLFQREAVSLDKDARRRGEHLLFQRGTFFRETVGRTHAGGGTAG